ncbi:LLM class flavin-dependent oxidoreductase [Streptomyces koyangensis]|uniref:LLM class flavin-dependent oxidoreductase n=1 Tax=Streptomyces koyangensis TaxID=188770 RepID=UPI003C2E9CA9
MDIGIAYLGASSSSGRAELISTYDDFFGEVRWAEGRGFSGIWITEHHFSTYSASSSPLLLLARAAMLAPSLRVGTSVLVLPLWDPARLVADVSTLDVLTGGRFDLGIGRGYQPHEFLGWGRDVAGSRGRFEESVELMLRLLTEEDVTFSGDHHRVAAPVTVLPRPVQSPHPPVWMAAVSAESVRYAARHGFHLLTPAAQTVGQLAVQSQLMATALRESGRDPAEHRVSTTRYVYCGADARGRDTARREAARQLQFSSLLAGGGIPYGGNHPAVDEVDPVLVEKADELLLAGEPDAVLEQLERLAGAGATQVIAGFRYGDMPRELARRSMELFAGQVLPYTKDIQAEGFWRGDGGSL